MTLSDLNPHELRVFMGLFKLMVHADREVSSQERAVITRLATALGVRTWNSAVAQARAAYATVEELEADARRVTRRAARTLIHNILADVAYADRLVDAEVHVLRWMTQNWGAPPPSQDLDSYVIIED